MNSLRTYLLELLDEEKYSYRTALKHNLMVKHHEACGSVRIIEQILRHLESEMNNELVEMNRIEQLKIALDPDGGLTKNLDKIIKELK